MPNIIKINPKYKIPISSRIGKKFSFRFGFERSSDSISSDTDGQDYLAAIYDTNQISFALCDGVSQSFFGDIAAKILGDSLVDWFWNNRNLRTMDLAVINSALSSFLDQLPFEARQQVQEFQLPEGLALMLPEVLEKKRALGSETTFVTGNIDFITGRIFLAWMGDSRLRLWKSNKELSDTLLDRDSFQTKERWSTHRGQIGKLHTIALKIDQIDRCILYSDGLAKLDKKVGEFIPGSTTLEQLIQDTHHFPTSDDISYLEIFWGSNPNWDKLRPKAPGQFIVIPDEDNGTVGASWRPVRQATNYEIAVITSRGWRVYETNNPEFSIDYKALREGSLSFCVRTWIDGEVSPWSRLEKVSLKVVDYEQPVASLPTPPLSYPSPRKMPQPTHLPRLNTHSMATKSRNNRRGYILAILPLLLVAFMLVLSLSIGGNQKYHPRQLTSWAKHGTLIITETSTPTVTLTPTEKPTKTPTPTEKPSNLLEENSNPRRQSGKPFLKLWEWLLQLLKKKETSNISKSNNANVVDKSLKLSYEINRLSFQNYLSKGSNIDNNDFKYFEKC